MKRLALPTIFLACGAFFASGCVYKMNIQQGNYLVTDSVSQLKEGMTRSQVRFLLGTPMVPDAFDDRRWDYYYFFKLAAVQGAAQAPPDGLFRGRKRAAHREPGRAHADRSRAARARSAKGHRSQQEESQGTQEALRAADAPRRDGATLRRHRNLRANARRRPRSRPILCRLPRLCPLPPGLLRVSLERPVDLDPVAVARHRVAVAQLAEDSDVGAPTGLATSPACARACASASATVRRIGERHLPLPLPVRHRDTPPVQRFIH